MTAVVDASLVAAGLRDDSAVDRWAEQGLVDAPLVTLDLRLARSPGTRCSFLTPPDLG